MVIKENPPKKLWKNLEEFYTAKSLTKWWILKRQLFRLRMEVSESASSTYVGFNALMMIQLRV